ncbi:MAG: hypothetical protein SGILL_009292 [Bacillariaceae sp.]
MCTPTPKKRNAGDNGKSSANNQKPPTVSEPSSMDGGSKWQPNGHESMAAAKQSSDGSGKKRAYENVSVKLSHDDGVLASEILGKAKVSAKKRLVTFEGENGGAVEPVLTIGSGEFLATIKRFEGQAMDTTNQDDADASSVNAVHGGYGGEATHSNMYQVFAADEVGGGKTVSKDLHEAELSKLSDTHCQQTKIMEDTFNNTIAKLQEEVACLKQENDDLKTTDQVSKKVDADGKGPL